MHLHNFILFPEQNGGAILQDDHVVWCRNRGLRIRGGPFIRVGVARGMGGVRGRLRSHLVWW